MSYTSVTGIPAGHNAFSWAEEVRKQKQAETVTGASNTEAVFRLIQGKFQSRKAMCERGIHNPDAYIRSMRRVGLVIDDRVVNGKFQWAYFGTVEEAAQKVPSLRSLVAAPKKPAKTKRLSLTTPNNKTIHAFGKAKAAA